MKRSEFLKRLGLGIAAIPLAPQIVAATKEAFDGAEVDALMSDEEGIWANEVPKEWTVEKTMETFKETGDLVYSHYEEPWIHKSGWPVRINDHLLFPDEKVYVVTALSTGGTFGPQQAVCTPIDGRDPIITITEEYGGEIKFLIIGNLNARL